MTPFPPAVQLLLLGCGLLALILPGCGEEGSAAQEKPVAKPQVAREVCPPQLDAFVKELRTLRRELAVGLSYDRYKAAVGDLRASYAAIPVERLALDCLSTAGTPAEQALNKYIDGANAWGECLADAACTTATVEPVLQRKWRVASRHLGEAG